MRVVDPEHRDAVVDPVLHHPQHLGVQPLRVVVEVQRVDVLVLLGRVLGVGDRAVDPGGEPLGVLAGPGVVGGALQREVEGHLEPQRAGGGHEGVEVVDGAQVGVDGVVAALGRADRPGGARVVGLRGQGVVAALAVDLADRVDRRQVDQVEAHRRDRRQPLGGLGEGARDPGAVGADVGALGPREELVPRAEQRPGPLHRQLVGGRAGHQVAHRGGVQHGVHGRRGAGGEPGRDGAAAVAQPGHGVAQRLHVGRTAGLVGDRPLQQPGALLEHEVDVHVGGDLDGGVVLPGGERVAPGLDPEGPAALAVGDHHRAVAVGAGGQQPHRRPGVLDAVRVDQDGGGRHGVVALAEDGGGHRDRLADHGLGRPASAVHHRAERRAPGSARPGCRGEARGGAPGRGARDGGGGVGGGGPGPVGAHGGNLITAEGAAGRETLELEPFPGTQV